MDARELNDEAGLLLRFLDQERNHVVGILEGLSQEQLRQPVLPSGWNCLDMAPRQPDPLWKEWGMDFPSLRFIMLHMIKETANHAGHLDAARELIDGRQWVIV